MGRIKVHPSSIRPGGSVTVRGMLYACIGVTVRAETTQVAV